MQGTGIYSATTASAVQSLIAPHMSGSLNITFRWYPATKTSGCEFWTGCTLLSAYQETAPVNGAVALAFTLQSSSGSLTASTV